MMKPFPLDNITVFLFLDVLASLSRVVALAIEPIKVLWNSQRVMDRMEENGVHNNHTPNCMMITFKFTIKMKLE